MKNFSCLVLFLLLLIARGAAAAPVNQAMVRDTVAANEVLSFGVCKVTLEDGAYTENPYPFDVAIVTSVAGGDCSTLEEGDCVSITGRIHSGLTFQAGYVHMFALGWVEEDESHCD